MLTNLTNPSVSNSVVSFRSNRSCTNNVSYVFLSGSESLVEDTGGRHILIGGRTPHKRLRGPKDEDGRIGHSGRGPRRRISRDECLSGGRGPHKGG